MSDTMQYQLDKTEQKQNLKSSHKVDNKKMSKIDENNASSNVEKQSSQNDDIHEILFTSSNESSCAGAICPALVETKKLRFTDDEYEDDSINNSDYFAQDSSMLTLRKTLSMTNRFEPDDASTGSFQRSICNISIHSQAMGGLDYPNTPSESGTKESKAFTNNTTSISSSTISSDPHSRPQGSLSIAGTSGGNDYNFLVKSISQIESFTAASIAKKVEELNHATSQSENVSTPYFINENVSMHATMEAVLNAQKQTQQYYYTSSDLEQFNNQKSILTIHPQYRILVSDTNSPEIIQSTVFNNGHPEQLQQRIGTDLLSAKSSEETIRSKLSEMNLNESVVMGTLSSNVSHKDEDAAGNHAENMEKTIGKYHNKEDSISQIDEYWSTPEENILEESADFIRNIFLEKTRLAERRANRRNISIARTDSNVSIEEKISTRILQENLDVPVKKRSLSDILGPFSTKIDRLIELEQSYNQDDTDKKDRRVSFAAQEFNTVEYVTQYDNESDDNFDIHATSIEDISKYEDKSSESTRCYVEVDSNHKFEKSSSGSEDLHSEFDYNVDLGSIENLSPLCGVLGTPVMEFKELSLIYKNEDLSDELFQQDSLSTVEDEEMFKNDLSNSRVTSSKGFSSSQYDSTTTPYLSGVSSAKTLSRSVTDSIIAQRLNDEPAVRKKRWSYANGLPPILECLDMTEMILIDVDNGALKRDHGIMMSYSNEQVFTFKNRLGEVLFYGIEHPKFCSINSCVRGRPFDMNIYGIDGREVMTLSRYMTCLTGCVLPCFYHAIVTYCPGQIQLGKVKQDITLCIPSYTVYDNSNKDLCTLRGPFGACFCDGNVDFIVYDSTPEGFINIGLITDHWNGENTYMFDDHRFGVKFPIFIDPKLKVLLLSAAVLLKYVYFSGSFGTSINNNSPLHPPSRDGNPIVEQPTATVT